MSDPESTGDRSHPDLAEVPDWDDEYIDRVSDRLMHNYDLEKDFAVEGRRFDLYGRLFVESEKHFFHPVLNYANHRTVEHLFARRVDRVDRRDLEALVELGHRLADEWIDPDEEHFGTEFTFVLVAPEIPDGVGEFVSGFRERTLLKYGYHGHYEVNLAVVAPDPQRVVASEVADVAGAFALWDPIEREEPRGFFARLKARLAR